MAAPLLDFLYPRFFLQQSRAPTLRRLRSKPADGPTRHTRSIQTSTSWLQVPRERHGKAIEPDPNLLQPPPQSSGTASVNSLDTSTKLDSRDPIEPLRSRPSVIELLEPQTPPEEASKGASADQSLPLAVMQTPQSELRPLESILQVQNPTTLPERQRPPHLTAPPYEHHFDTYSLVQDLAAGSFTNYQAVTLMKSIRASLADHLETAKESLVSKSDVENEAYLFKAACSELRTDVNSQRYATRTRDKSDTIRLEHERDVLTQRLSQDLATLKDDFARLFNDRKMAVREHQKARDLKIQELNFKIAVQMGSDMKPHVESLRWALTLRGVIGLLTCVATILLVLRRNSELNEKAHRKLKEQEREQARMTQEDGERGRKVLKDSGSQTDKEGISVESLSMG